MSGIKTDKSKIKGRVVVVLENVKTGIKRVLETENIVTNAGDLYYAERGALLTVGATISPVPTNFTDANGVPDMIMELYESDSGAPAKGNDRSDLGTLVTDSGQAMDGTYPQVDDQDSDNTGKGADIITYCVSYATGDANSTDIADVILTNPGVAADDALIMHASFTPFPKTTSDTLKVFINHEMLGV